MQKLVIIGAGGFGRETYGYSSDIIRDTGVDWRIKGFLDDNPSALDGYEEIHCPILSEVAAYKPAEDDVFICAIGQPMLRRKLADRIREQDGRFISLVHPTVYIGRNVRFGPGCIFAPRVVLTSDIRIGSFVCLNVGTCVGHDAVIKDWAQTGNLCDVTGYATMGEGAFLGSRATLLPNKKVGDWAVAGAGSIVSEDVPARRTVFGSPARLVPEREESAEP